MIARVRRLALIVAAVLTATVLVFPITALAEAVLDDAGQDTSISTSADRSAEATEPAGTDAATGAGDTGSSGPDEPAAPAASDPPATGGEKADTTGDSGSAGKGDEGSSGASEPGRGSDTPAKPAEVTEPEDDRLIIVSPNGDASNSGRSSTSPWPVAHAIRNAPPGATIVFLDGTYRGVSVEVDKPLTLRARAGASPVLDGSVRVTGWTADGDVWRADDFLDGRQPPAEVRVWVDGEALDRAGSRDAVGPGSYHVAGDTLFIGVDPDGRVVEASAYDHAFILTGGGRGTQVSGLTFRHYAAAPVLTVGAGNPGPSDPGPSDPSPSDPSPSDPGPVNPGPVVPGPGTPGPVNPGPVEPPAPGGGPAPSSGEEAVVVPLLPPVGSVVPAAPAADTAVSIVPAVAPGDAAAVAQAAQEETTTTQPGEDAAAGTAVPLTEALPAPSDGAVTASAPATGRGPLAGFEALLDGLVDLLPEPLPAAIGVQVLILLGLLELRRRQRRQLAAVAGGVATVAVDSAVPAGQSPSATTSLLAKLEAAVASPETELAPEPTADAATVALSTAGAVADAPDAEARAERGEPGDAGKGAAVDADRRAATATTGAAEVTEAAEAAEATTDAKDVKDTRDAPTARADVESDAASGRTDGPAADETELAVLAEVSAAQREREVMSDLDQLDAWVRSLAEDDEPAPRRRFGLRRR